MKLLDTLKNNKKKGAALLAVLVVVVGAATAAKPILAAGGSTSATYKEEQVSFGDLTVGITESGTASLESTAVSYPVAVEVLEVAVKAGQRVSKGDVLLKVDLSALKDEYSTLEAAYNSAVLKLEEAQQNQATGAINAKYTYDSSQLGGQTAEDQYDYDITSIAYNLSAQEDTVDELVDKLNELADSRTLSREDRAAKLTAYNDALAAYNGFTPDAGNPDGSDAALAELKVAMEKAKTAYEAAVKDYDKACTDYSSTSASLTTARLKLAQLQNQEEVNSLTAQADKEKALAQNTNADSVYSATINQLATAVTSARAAVNDCKKSLDKVSAYITDGVITAPQDGLVMAVGCAAGDSLNANSTLLTLASKKIFVMVSISQDDIADLSLGQSVQLDFDAYDDVSFTGTIDSISYSAARMGSTSVSYTVTVVLDEELDNIFEGMTCDATFITRQEKDCVYLSNRAVTTNSDGSQTVKLKGADGNPVVTTVTSGFSDGRNVQILTGLAQGDTVLIESKVNS